MKIITLSNQLETLKKEDVVFLLKEVMEHEEISKSKKHMDALRIALDLLENPEPRAWLLSSDSDVLRCPNCKLRVPGENPWRRSSDYVEPMNIFCKHGDTIYDINYVWECPGCGKMLEAVLKSGEKWTMKTYSEGIREVVLKECEK